MSGPLDGVKIVDLTAAASGPLATAILADQGAEGTPTEVPPPAPRLGQHTEEILTDLGYDEAARSELFRTRVVA